MKHIFINVTNHKYKQFPKELKEHVDIRYDEIFEIDYPMVSKESNDYDILLLANKLIEEVQHIIEKIDLTKGYHYVEVSTCGEFGLTWVFVSKLKELNKWYNKFHCLEIVPIYPTSERKVYERDGKTTHMYEFYGFRRYL